MNDNVYIHGSFDDYFVVMCSLLMELIYALRALQVAFLHEIIHQFRTCFDFSTFKATHW